MQETTASLSDKLDAIQRDMQTQATAQSRQTYLHTPAQLTADDLLAQAHTRLAELPTDQVPVLTDLPAGSRMPLLANPNFVGRDKELLLAATLKDSETAAITAATGIGGVGKSQLATEFVHRYGTFFFTGGVFWLSFADPASIPVKLASCGAMDALNLHPDFANFPINEQVKLVSAYLKSPLPKRLVFDNCEDHTLLAQWHPKQGGSRMLVTSRKASWPKR